MRALIVLCCLTPHVTAAPEPVALWEALVAAESTTATGLADVKNSERNLRDFLGGTAQ
jgi:hypothetical protein